MKMSRSLSALGFCLLLPSGCITKQNPYPDPPYVEPVDDPKFFDFTVWEQHCYAMPDISPEAFDDVLNFYGRKGWELVGFVNDNGRTSRYCLKRKR